MYARTVQGMREALGGQSAPVLLQVAALVLLAASTPTGIVATNLGLFPTDRLGCRRRGSRFRTFTQGRTLPFGHLPPLSPVWSGTPLVALLAPRC